MQTTNAGQKPPAQRQAATYKAAASRQPAPIKQVPVTKLGQDVELEAWDAVGGHAAVVQQLKEMVMLPLQYPEFFTGLHITPPR